MSSVYCLGAGVSFDIKTLLPHIDYTTLTNDNFIAAGTGLNGFSSNKTDGFNKFFTDGYTISKSYNATNGILTIGGNSCTVYSSGNYPASAGASSTVIAYLIIGTIQRL